MKRLYKLITILLLCFYTAVAQEGLKKHTVSNGETLLSISKVYNITPYDLQKANPNVLNGIKPNDILIIPESKIKSPHLKSLADSIKASVVSSSISHTVKTGDTKFSLAKRYGLTVSQLESQNPQIISELQLGEVLEIFPSTTYKDAKIASNRQTEPSSSPLKPKLKEGKKHEVQKGETVFRVASAYGLTEDELLKANSKTITGGLKIGQILWIPGSNDYKISDGNKEYVVKYGDTKFSLSRRFNTTVQDLERKNPHITNMLIVGQTITMPTDETQSKTIEATQPEPSKTQTVTPTKEIEVVEEDVRVVEDTPEVPVQEVEKKQETVVKETPSEEVAPKEKEIVATNTRPDEVIDQPVVKDAVDEPVSQVVSDPVSTTNETINLPKVTAGLADLKNTAKTSQAKKLLFFLPFSETDYQNYAKNNDNFKTISDDFKRNHLEFYKGAHIAIDSIKKMNLNVEVDIIEALSTNQTAKIKSLIQENTIKNYDAIILPFYKTVEEEIATFTADRNIPVITASPIAYKNNTDNLYSALPSVNEQRLKVLDHMTSKNAHIIVLSDINRAESKAFITKQVPRADFVDIKRNGSFSEGELKSKFKKDQLNYVVIDSDRNSVFLNATNALLSELSNYKLELAVLEASLIPDDSDVSQKRYQILKMIFPSLIPAKSTESSKQFLSDYQKKYKLLPSANIMLGFDITFDSLLRLMQQQSFEYTATNYSTEYTQLKFDYEKNTLGGYSNTGVYILQYDSNANIREAN